MLLFSTGSNLKAKDCLCLPPETMIFDYAIQYKRLAFVYLSFKLFSLINLVTQIEM